MKTINNLLIVILFGLLVSCDKLTQYSPYDANTKYSDINPTNIEEILSQQIPDDSLVFIAISDTHTDYSDLRASISSINKMEGISFVMVCGDITDWGLFSEFESYYHLIRRLNIPYVTLIGNHDYLSNGKLIFNKMFGSTSFYFDLGKYRMVIFDNVVWENENKAPDFDWFRQALNVPEGMTSIACYHIHPLDPQLANGYADKMREIIEENPVILSIFGHGHDTWEETVNNRRYFMVPDVTLRSMAKITLANQTATIQLLSY